MGPKFHYFFSTGALYFSTRALGQKIKYHPGSGLWARAVGSGLWARGCGLGLGARAGADPLCALILLDKYTHTHTYTLEARGFAK